jgi:hypothetical protein
MNQSKGEIMKKYTYALAIWAMTLLIGCSGEEPYKQQSPNSDTPQVEAKKLAEVSSTNETQIVCDKFKLVVYHVNFAGFNVSFYRFNNGV